MSDIGKSILVVDDEEIIRNVCHRSLSKRGYSVALAENGVTALEYLAETPCDIVFTDFKMPMMNGLEVLDAIKTRHSHVEVIIMTAFATIESAINAMKKGAYDFILKPIKPDQLRMVADKCSEKIQLGEENKILRSANEKLTELQLMKNKFIAITSHELRTPVSHLKGYLGILNDEYYEQLSRTEQEQCMQVILDAIDDLEDIVTNMHNLIHLENGSFALNVESVEVNKMISQITHAYRLISKKRNQTIKVVDAPGELRAQGDRSQVKGIVSELLQNAIKFTPDGGEIELSARNEGEFCVISVKDNGIGIADSELVRIFEKFYEVQNSNYHSSSKEAFMGGGLGLGLPSVKAIAEAHGGCVKVTSEEGRGSEFAVYLPLEKRN